MSHSLQHQMARAFGIIAAASLGAGCAGRSIGEPEAEIDPPGKASPIGAAPVEQAPTVAAAAHASVDQPSTDVPAAVAPLPESTIDAEQACRRQPQGERATPTEDAFRQLLVGSWLLCDPVSVFGTSDEVGIVLNADFTWHKLLRGQDGKLVASDAWEQSGRWESIDTSIMNGPGVYQLNLNIDGSGTVMTQPVFAVEPNLLRLNNEGVFVADYAKL